MQKWFEGSKLYLTIFLLLTIGGLSIRYLLGEQSILWGIWSSVDVAFAVSLGVLAFFAYREMLSEEDAIALSFDIVDEPNEASIPLGISVLRKECTRSEILGILGMIQQKSTERFNYETTLLKPLLEEIATVQTDRSKMCCIVPIRRRDYENHFADALSELTVKD